MKALIILNPHAHSGIDLQQKKDMHLEISAQLKSALDLETLEWCETEYPGHGTKLAEEATRNGYTYIFAAGGDGTINEVLNGIMRLNLAPKDRPAMGVLPYGTSNDFFAALKFAESMHQSQGKNTAVTFPIDIGQARFDDLERYFCLMVGIGLWSWANEQYLEESKTFGRRFAHIPAAIKTLLSYQFLSRVHLSIDGKRSKPRRVLSVIVNNSPIIAGGLTLTPDAIIDDGYLDLCIVKRASLLRLIVLVFQVVTKTHLHSPRVIAIGQIHEIMMTAKRKLPITIDGELVPELGSKAFRTSITTLPEALRIVIPSICELAPPTAKTL